MCIHDEALYKSTLTFTLPHLRTQALFVAARPLMLSRCLASSPTDTYNDVTSFQHQHPVTSPLHSPTSMGGVAVVGDGGRGFLSPVNSSPGSSARPWPTSPTDQRSGVFQLDTWVRGSAESLVGQVSLPYELFFFFFFFAFVMKDCSALVIVRAVFIIVVVVIVVQVE